MKNYLFVIVLLTMASLFSCLQAQQNPFWGDGKEFFDIQVIDSGYRVHSVNITVAMDGTVLFGGGDISYLRTVPLQKGVNIPLWRSDDGGKTWVPDATYPISSTGSWGLQVDETTGDVLKFDTKFNFRRGCGEHGSPPEEFVMWRSRDHGRTWTREEIEQEKDINGWYSWAGGCETGISLQYGVNKGRLLRATCVFVEYQVGRGEFFGDHYSSAIYSDYDILIYSNIDSPSGRKNSTVWASFDGGRTWPVKRQVDEGGSAYSSLAAGRKGTPSEGLIFLLKEGIGEDAHNGIKAAHFNLAWITQGRDWREFILPAERRY